LLAGLWIAVYLPSILRARRTTPLPAAKNFKQAMRLIAPQQAPRTPLTEATGRRVLVPRPVDPRTVRNRSLRTRRLILGALAGAAAITAVLALFVGGDMIEIHLLADGCLLFYVAILFETKRRSDERAEKVRPLRQAPAEPRERWLVSAGGGRPR
jgi:hypothetical protein